MSRRRFLGRGALAVAGVAAGVAVDARWIELHWLEVVRRPMAIAGLPPAWEARTLLQVSDLHIGPRVDDRYIGRVLARARAESADLVAYTGDFVSMGPDSIEKLNRHFAGAPRGRVATLAVLGNHDYGRSWSHPEIAARVARVLEGHGVRVLRNELLEIEGLQVAGYDDLWAGAFDQSVILATLDPARAHLALSHNPDTADHPGLAPLRGWILSGHTHGGQVRIPPFPPPVLPVRNRRYAAGEIGLGEGRRLYVSRGVGHLTPIRFGVRPELTVFSLVRA